MMPKLRIKLGVAIAVAVFVTLASAGFRFGPRRLQNSLMLFIPDLTEVEAAKAIRPDVKSDGIAEQAGKKTIELAENVPVAKTVSRIIKLAGGHVAFLKGEADEQADVARAKAILRIIKGTPQGERLQLSDDPGNLARVKDIRPGVKEGSRAGQAGGEAVDPVEGVARARAILQNIEEASRDERLRLWEEIDGLRARSDQVRSFLSRFAREEAGRADPYPRFVASATAAGFGRPSRLGPNDLAGTSLEWYIRFQRGMRVSGPRRLELDPTLNYLKVTVAPNAKNDLTFTEILWTILVKYKLSFKLDRTETFVILPPSPLA